MRAGAEASQVGNYAEAEKSWRAALGEAERLGSDAPQLFVSLDRLGGLYFARGKYADAEPLLRRAMSIREKALGPDDPAVAESLVMLALNQYGAGRYAEAEPLLHRALAIREKSLGPEHPVDVVALALGLGPDLPALIDGRLRALGPLLRRRTLALV